MASRFIQDTLVVPGLGLGEWLNQRGVLSDPCHGDIPGPCPLPGPPSQGPPLRGCRPSVGTLSLEWALGTLQHCKGRVGAIGGGCWASDPKEVPWDAQYFLGTGNERNGH